MSRPAQCALPGEPAADSGWLDLVRQHVGSLRYGAVQIIVHDGHVTQIEKTERVRLESRDRTANRVGHPAASAANSNARSTP
ncbi:MAG: YezD family protein [Limisphaerales bacterium]